MKKMLIIITVALFTNLTAKGQNLFLIGEKSYPCTNAITLDSNPHDLDVFFINNGKSGLFAASTKSSSVHKEKFTNKLIIYLEDGNVLICSDIEEAERVDDRAKALYPLTADQLSKLKTSNIHTVKYTVVDFLGEENSFSASNTGAKTNTLISEFFKQINN